MICFLFSWWNNYSIITRAAKLVLRKQNVRDKYMHVLANLTDGNPGCTPIMKSFLKWALCRFKQQSRKKKNQQHKVCDHGFWPLGSFSRSVFNLCVHICLCVCVCCLLSEFMFGNKRSPPLTLKNMQHVEEEQSDRGGSHCQRAVSLTQRIAAVRQKLQFDCYSLFLTSVESVSAPPCAEVSFMTPRAFKTWSQLLWLLDGHRGRKEVSFASVQTVLRIGFKQQ